MEVSTEPLPTLKKCVFYNFGNISQDIGSPSALPPNFLRIRYHFLRVPGKYLESGPLLFTYSLLKHCFLRRPYGTPVCPPRALVIQNKRKARDIHMQSPYVSHLNMNELDGIQ